MEMIRRGSTFFVISMRVSTDHGSTWCCSSLSSVETGLVVTPFLPGDSLLFAMGTLAAKADSPLSLPLLIVLLIAAAILGDAVNYVIGYRVDPGFFNRSVPFLQSEASCAHAGVLREVREQDHRPGPLRPDRADVCAPFVAGIGKMSYRRFAVYNVLGGVAWVTLCLVAGYLFGNVPFVENDHLELVLVAIILISVMPMVAEYVAARRRRMVQESVTVEVE